MAATWQIKNLKYYLSMDKKEKVVYMVDYKAFDSKKVDEESYSSEYSGSINLDLELIEAADEIPEVPAVLYTDKDTLLADKAVKIGDVKTPAIPAVPAVKAKNPWADVDFVEYDKLTEDVVIGWVKAILGEDRVKNIENEILEKINAQENPPAATEGSGVPW